MKQSAWHALKTEEIIKYFEVDAKKGLSAKEASKRLEKYGPNELKKEEKVSPFIIFFNQFKNILLIILLFAVALSAAVGEFHDAIIILIIVIFCAVLGFVQEYRAEKAVEALKKVFSPVVRVLRGGEETTVPSKEIVPGDVLLLEAGDRIAADARLIESHSLRCDEASLTGESQPVEKIVKPISENTRPSDRNNIVFGGTIVTYGRGKGCIVATGSKTEFGKIAEGLISVKKEDTPLERRTKEIGKWLSIAAITVCILVIAISLIRQVTSGGEINFEFLITMTMFAIALAVAAVPEALPAIVTGALAIGMHQMAKKNALVRKMPAVETLGSTTVICSDKTGTLTKGEMTVRKIYASENMIDVAGVGYEPKGEISGNGKINTEEKNALRLLILNGILCNDAGLYQKEDKWKIKGDPTEAALVVMAEKAGFKHKDIRSQYPRKEEIPFSSERKLMTTIHEIDGQPLAFVKGAPEVIMKKCSQIQNNQDVKPFSDEEKSRIEKKNEEMSSEGLRVLGLAYRQVKDSSEFSEENIEKELVFLGLIGMIDPPREESKEAVKTCKEIHIKPIMITGDHKLTAFAIAKEIGIAKEDDRVVDGNELEKMSQDELEKIVEKVTVYARVSPTDKLKIVKAWKSKGQIVAMTGDGVNDAPALKQADIGIAMGIAGTEVAKEAADMVLADDNFATIVTAIERGRWIFDNIKKYLVFLLQANIVEVLVIGGIVMVMGPEFLPLLPAAILYVNLATDGLPALALGIAPPDPDIMKRPPRDPNESVWGIEIKSFLLQSVLVQCPIFFGIFFLSLADMTLARTRLFFTLVVIQLILSLNFRSLKYSIFKTPPHKWLILAVLWELILLGVIVLIPAVRDAFGIHLPSVQDMLFIGLFSIITTGVIEIIKIFLRKKTAA